MSYSRVALRYASALLKAAVQGNSLEAVRADIDLLKTALGASREFQHLLKSPIVQSERKVTVLRNIFADKVSPTTMNFLLLLLEKKREAALPNIVTSFDEQYNQHMGIADVTIRSAIELDEAQKNSILDKVRKYTGKSVVAHYVIDPSLIGGFLVKIGDTVLDGSVRHQLDNLKKTLATGALNN
jgi:F-type H+-transporting ATPase subunit delta